MAVRKQRKNSLREKSEKGSSMLEGLFVICFLMFVFLAMLQVFQWAARHMISEYASFYGTKALALGYAAENCRKAVRVAAMGMSGKDMSDKKIPLNSGNARYDLQEQARKYMTMGIGSGIDFEYWGSQRNSEAYLSIGMTPFRNPVINELRLRKAPLLVPAMAKVLSLSPADGARVPEAASENYMYNYASIFLKK